MSMYLFGMLLLGPFSGPSRSQIAGGEAQKSVTLQSLQVIVGYTQIWRVSLRLSIPCPTFMGMYYPCPNRYAPRRVFKSCLLLRSALVKRKKKGGGTVSPGSEHSGPQSSQRKEIREQDSFGSNSSVLQISFFNWMDTVVPQALSHFTARSLVCLMWCLPEPSFHTLLGSCVRGGSSLISFLYPSTATPAHRAVWGLMVKFKWRANPLWFKGREQSIKCPCSTATAAAAFHQSRLSRTSGVALEAAELFGCLTLPSCHRLLKLLKQKDA